MIAAMAQDPPPRRLVLGSSGYDAVIDTLEQTLADIRMNQSLSRSADFPPDRPGSRGRRCRQGVSIVPGGAAGSSVGGMGLFSHEEFRDPPTALVAALVVGLSSALGVLRWASTRWMNLWWWVRGAA